MRNYLLFFVFLSCFASSEEGWFSGTFSQVRSGLFSFFGYGESQDDFQQLHDMTRCKPGDVGEDEEPSRTQNRSVGQWLVDGLKSQKGKKIVCYVLAGGAVIAVTGGVGVAVGLPFFFSGGGSAALLSVTGAVSVPTVSELATVTVASSSVAVLSSMIPQDVSPSKVSVDIIPTHVLSEITSMAPEATPTSRKLDICPYEAETTMPARPEPPFDSMRRPTGPVRYRSQAVLFSGIVQWFENVLGIDIADVVEDCEWV